MNHLALCACFIMIANSSFVFAQQNTPFEKAQSNQFNYVLYDDLAAEEVDSQISFLEENYLRVMEDLKVNEMPKITVRIWREYENLYQAQEERYGIRYEGSGGSVWWSESGEPEILAIYDKRFEGRRQHTTGLLHEFAHLVTQRVNPSIANNPRWLWEAIALYEATGYLRGFPRIDYIEARDFPTLTELNVGFNDANETRNIYQVGYVLAEYIVETWGTEKLLSLVESNGNIPSTLGINITEFELGWHQFIEEKYLSN